MSDEEIIIPERFPEKARWLRVYIWVAACLLLAGLVSPIITLTKFMLVENTFSVLSGVVELLQEGRIFLFLLIAGFSIVLPILKLWVLYRLVSKSSAVEKSMRKLLHWMHLYGKWSMLDVFVVAILLVTVKLEMMANIIVHEGVPGQLWQQLVD